MTLDITFIGSLVSFLNLLAIGFGVFVFAKKGGNTASEQAISTYKDAVAASDVRIKQLEEENIRLHSEISNIKQQLGKLQGLIEEKDKKLEEMRVILENRNPAFDAIPAALVALKDVAGEAKVFMVDAKEKIDEIYSYHIKNETPKQ